MSKLDMEIARDILVAALASEKFMTLNGDDGDMTPELLGEAYSTICAAVLAAHSTDS